MKKILFTIFVLSLFIMTACAKEGAELIGPVEEVLVEDEPAPEVESPAPVMVEEPEEAGPGETGPGDTEPIESGVLAELEEAFSKIKSYEYNFNDDHYFVKGDKMVVELMNLIRFGKDSEGNFLVVNTLFIDNDKKIIEGSCERNQIVLGNPSRTHEYRRRIVCLPLESQIFDLDYDEYYVENPRDIFNRYRPIQPDEILEETFGKKTHVSLKYGNVTLKVDKSTGILDEVSEAFDGIINSDFYTLRSINQLKDAHMERKG